MVILSWCGQTSTTITSPDVTEPELSQTIVVIPTIYMLGDSLTAGYQLPLDESYPMVVEDLLTQQWYQLKVINAGESWDTSSGLLQRLARVSADAVSWDIAIVAIGANDGLRWWSTDVLYDNILAIITDLQSRGITTIVAGMQIPTNLWNTYRSDFTDVYPRVAQATDSPLLPFLLEWVGGVRSLNLPDGIHPNTEWQKIVANTVAEFLINQKIISK